VFFDKVLTKIFGTANERTIKRLMPMVAVISALEADTKKLTDDQLREKTTEFRARIAARLEGIPDDAEHKDERKAAEREALDEVYTKGEGVLHFSGGHNYMAQDVHMRDTIKYTDYKQFGSTIKIFYEGKDITPPEKQK
jgi:UDP-N-acetylmuramyl tripeptide synthase